MNKQVQKNTEYGMWNMGNTNTHSRKHSASFLHSTFHIPHSARGFTFIETLVAISILLLAIASPLTLASQGLTASRIARDSTIATYLAQEGIEYVYNVRHSNALSGTDNWLAGLEDCVDTVGCEIDVMVPKLNTCDSADSCSPLMFHEGDGVYGLGSGSGWEETKFTRRILVTTDGASEAAVIVTVTWKDGIRNRSLTLQERIFDWP